MTITVRERPPPDATGRTDAKASIVTWKGHKMVRQHSFLASVAQIARWSKEIDVTKVGLVGDMHAGKTTAALAIAHAFHETMAEKYNMPFAVRVLTKEHLRQFEATLQSLTPANYVLIFDDVSFMESKSAKKEIAQVREAITTIRHMEAGRDTKILILYNYHYNLGLDKFLRQTDFRFWFSIGSSEYENMEKIMHDQRKMKLVTAFQRWRVNAINTGTWSVPLGNRGSHTYKFRDPWIPALFTDNQHLRMVVSPTRQFMAPKCPVCALAQSGPSTDEIPVAEFVEKACKAYGETHFKTALKLILLENGLATYSRGVLAAKRGIEASLRVHAVSLEKLMIECGMEINKPRLRAGYSKFLESVSVPQLDAPEKPDHAPGADAAEPAEKAAPEGPESPKPAETLESPKPAEKAAPEGPVAPESPEPAETPESPEPAEKAAPEGPASPESPETT